MADEEPELYDEFGNYIGPDLDTDSSDDESEGNNNDDNDSDDQQSRPDGAIAARDDQSVVSRMTAATTATNMNQMVIADESLADITGDPQNAIVLHEDKEHYASAQETFGEGVRTAVLDEDAMP